MKELLALFLFTAVPPVFIMATWWFLCWEFDWSAELRFVMVIAGLIGFFTGISFINEVIHSQ